MKATVHFSKIKDEIITNLKRANDTIRIAVARFTDEVFFSKQATKFFSPRTATQNPGTLNPKLYKKMIKFEPWTTGST